MEEIDNRANWLGSDLQSSDAWIHYLTEAEVTEIEEALAFSDIRH